MIAGHRPPWLNAKAKPQPKKQEEEQKVEKQPVGDKQPVKEEGKEQAGEEDGGWQTQKRRKKKGDHKTSPEKGHCVPGVLSRAPGS